MAQRRTPRAATPNGSPPPPAPPPGPSPEWRRGGATGRGGTAASAVHAADMALYRAKDEGRNRICVADSTPIAAS